MIEYVFLLAFHSNYGAIILYSLRNIATLKHQPDKLCFRTINIFLNK